MTFEPPQVLLLGPGPSPTSPAVRQAQAAPLLGHLDPSFLALLDRVQQQLRSLFVTANRFTLPIAGTGTAGMEAVVANCIDPGDRVVVGVHGVFGQRMAEALRRTGAQVVEVRAEFGSSLDPEAIAAAVAAGPTHAIAVVHAETSTGVLTDLEPIAEVARNAGALFLLDCVTSFAGTPVEVDRLGIDAAFTGTQKCLSAPPGLSPVTLSDRALAKSAARAVRPPFYFDAALLTGYFGPDRAYHHTAPISMIYALAAALDEVESEGASARFARHRSAAAALRAGLEWLGLHPLVPAPQATPMLTTVRYPAGVDDKQFRSRLREQHAIEVGGGLGPLAGKVFRVGLMGHGARLQNVLSALCAFGAELEHQGGAVRLGEALGAAQAAYQG